MRQGTYLNVILTINAVLLGALLWTRVAEAPVLAQPALAQDRTTSSDMKPGFGVPNAGSQRDAMVTTLNDIRRTVESTRLLIESGPIQVEVTNLDRMSVMER